MSANLKIVHESEVQRQHVRVEMPGNVRIGEQVCKLKDLSVGGFSVFSPEKAETGPEGKVEFIFPFKGYALQFIVKAKATSDDRAKKISGFKFVELDASQISIVSHLVRSRMTGALVDGGELIGAATRNNFVDAKPRGPQEKKGLASALRRVLPTLLFTSLGLAGLALVLANAYENSSILKSYQGVVESDGRMVIRSFAEGNVRLLVSDVAERVTKGQPLAVIEKMSAAPKPAATGPEAASTGASPGEVTIVSPCDCSIQQRLVQNGEYRGIGEPLFTLLPADALPWVTTLVDPEKAHRLRLQDDVSIRIAGESGFVAGHIMDIGVESLDKSYAKVRIKPEKRISLDMIGRPAYVEFVLFK